MKIDRVILATDHEDLYRQFWPLVARAWRKLTLFTPTLIKVGEFGLDETLGQVIKLDPIEGIPTGFSSQVARLFIPVLYPDQVLLTSDIDMLPLNGDYFRNQVASVPDDCIVLYCSDAYANQPKYPICYIAAKGSVFAEILGFNDHPDLSDVQAKIKEWYYKGLGWNTDELMFARLLHEWKDFRSRCVLLKRGGWDPFAAKRIDRLGWKINKRLIWQDHYVDAHMLRPFKQHLPDIVPLMDYLQLERSEFGIGRADPLRWTYHRWREALKPRTRVRAWLGEKRRQIEQGLKANEQ